MKLSYIEFRDFVRHINGFLMGKNGSDNTKCDVYEAIEGLFQNRVEVEIDDNLYNKFADYFIKKRELNEYIINNVCPKTKEVNKKGNKNENI